MDFQEASELLNVSGVNLMEKRVQAGGIWSVPGEGAEAPLRKWPSECKMGAPCALFIPSICAVT